MKVTLEQIDDATWRATWYDPDGSVSDIWEGPFRSIVNWIIWRAVGRTFAIRKVRK